MVWVLGVTGGIGSGKTVVTNRLASHGIDVIDADIIAHHVVAHGAPALQAIHEHFGSSILLDNGELNRNKLRHIIFTRTDEKQWLESLLHPIINSSIKEKIAAAPLPYCVLVAPLLLEGDLHTIVDRIVLVDCCESLQIKRATQRDHTDIVAIKNIIKQQMSREEKQQKADIILMNEGSVDKLYQAVDQLHLQLNKELKP